MAGCRSLAMESRLAESQRRRAQIECDDMIPGAQTGHELLENQAAAGPQIQNGSFQGSADRSMPSQQHPRDVSPPACLDAMTHAVILVKPVGRLLVVEAVHALNEPGMCRTTGALSCDLAVRPLVKWRRWCACDHVATP